uniref:leucine-rich repeat receptor-like serine/threonine-protein kinase BAM3 n=1 Tax=Fragaria vesca subsp. vesca TaxID=101020 RepID=UPI0005C80649|nr:PREDICTED: leucine-rich repeat receptor-like serine/threonine-protein kinase BAM3 [Fragaria vesca subsp. vesca]
MHQLSLWGLQTWPASIIFDTPIAFYNLTCGVCICRNLKKLGRKMDSFCFAHHRFPFLFLATLYVQTISFCFCSSDGVPGSLRSACREDERQVLLRFRHDLADPSGRLSSWIGYDCCQWRGISCNNLTGHVVKMDLSNTYCQHDYLEWDEVAYRRSLLKGKLNPSFLTLTHLDYLDLSCNDFELPLFIGQLKSLRYLNLSSFSSSQGVIPESIGNLSSLKTLDLSSNYFDGIPIPQFFGQLKSLQYLDLSYALREEIPPHLGNLSNLSYLDLSANFWLTLTSTNMNWLSQLSSLKYLSLQYVDLSNTGVS